MSCGSPGQGTQTRGRHVAQEAKFGGRQCTGIKTENAVCLHEKMKSDKARFDEAIKAGAKPIYYCPVDCVWGEWTPWSLCPDCFGEESGIMEEDLKEFEQTRTRKVKVRPKFRGKKCGKSFFEMGTQKKCTKGTVPPCPEAAGAAFVSQWLHWGTCRAPCGKDGTRERSRQCHGEECKDELEEKAKCKGYCPPMGWSNWDQWSNCPVTCGKAQRARVRHCRDDAKEEMKNNSTCRGVARETQRCDMGKCGSKIELKYEGGKGDPIEKLEKKYEKEETEFEKNSATKTAEKGDSKSQGKASSASDGMAGGHESGGGGQEGKESPKIEKLPAREGKENSKEKANPSAAPPKEENKGGIGSMNSMESKESKEGSESKEKKASNSPGYGTQGGGNKGNKDSGFWFLSFFFSTLKFSL